MISSTYSLTSFWQHLSTDELFHLYKVLNTTTSAVLELIKEAIDMNPTEDRAFGFHLSFVDS